MWRLELDWYSPTRLLSSPIQYDFPGDRFIPSRSLMDLDHAQSLLTARKQDNRTKNPNLSDEYRKKIEENLTLDSEGKPFKMLVFRGSPKSCKNSFHLIDKTQREELEAMNNTKQRRRLPKTEARVLDAPNLKNDFYLNLLDWGQNNVLAAALGSELYLWNAETSNVQKLMQVGIEDDYPTSVAWSKDAKTVAVGLNCSKVQLWDAETSQLLRSLEGHRKRVGSLAWNEHLLSSGSQDKSIINHDVRARTSLTSSIQVHREEVCGLKWSSRGNLLASGGNDNLIHIWEASTMGSSKYLHRLNEHHAAVKALAWCPYQYNILASGGGTEDCCIKIWNLQTGMCSNSLDTKAQVCGLEWNTHHKEILSGHGYSRNHCQNRLCLWTYPSMTKVGEVERHQSRILHLSQSPDGLTVASAGADETLRFWKIFEPPQADTSRMTDLDSLLSLKKLLIR